MPETRVEISRDQVAHLADLARIDLSDEELDHLAPQLSVILESVASITGVAGDDVPPTSHAIPLTNVFRDDVVVPGLTADEALSRRPRAGAAALLRPPDPRRRAVTGVDLTRFSAAALADLLEAGDVSSVELTQAHLDRIAEVDPAVHAFLHVDADGALAQAGDADERRRAGNAQSRLDGIPIAVKDVLATRGLPTTCGSRILEGWMPRLRRHRGRPAACGRAADPGQDQHGRVRHGLVDRALGVRRDPQPVGPRPHPRWLRGRLGRRRRRVRGAPRDRHRHRRLDPAAGRRHRHGRA